MDNQYIERFSRQLLVPEIRTSGMLKIKNTKVCIVGAGGLGCPVGMYLVGIGIGEITIIDNDVVDITNLHRQTLHYTDDIGSKKVDSLAQKLRKMNPNTVINTMYSRLTSLIALDILSGHDILVDATDNIYTRYLISDSARVLGIPLVAGAALRMDGHISTWCYENGPCYRCIFPNPPPKSAIGSCSSNGVMGTVTGVIGTLMANEVQNLILGKPNYSGKINYFYGNQGITKLYNLREKRPECISCNQTIDPTTYDYKEFCGDDGNDKCEEEKILEKQYRLGKDEYEEKIKNEAVLLDVRDGIQHEIKEIPFAINLPLAQIEEVESILKDKDQEIICICRRGNDSQKAVVYLKKIGYTKVYDVIGGLYTHRQLYPHFPIY